MASKLSGIGDYFSSELQIAEAEEKLLEADLKIASQQKQIEQLQAKAIDNNSYDAAAIFVPLKKVIREPGQVRRYFDPDKLASLIESVKQLGIIEPLWVRPLPDGLYHLVAGERRYRAAVGAGLAEVPVTIRELDDTEALEISLVENLQRDDLNPIEETEGVLHLLAVRLETSVSEVIALLYRMKNESEGRVRENVFPKTSEQLIIDVFSALGRMSWQSFISSRLPLRNLPEDILEVLRQGKIEYTKARLIARVKDDLHRKKLLQEALEQNLTLTQIRELFEQLRVSANNESISLKKRLKETHHQLQKAKFWNDTKKRKQVEKLLVQMEALLAEQ